MANIKSPSGILEAAGNVIESAVDKAGDGVEALAGKASDAKEKIDKARFGPVFDLEQLEGGMPQVIYVEDNQRLKDIPACKGAIGFTERLRGVQMMRLLPKYRGVPGIRFYPDADRLLYCQDPCDDHLYVDINVYFDHLNAARADEIHSAAQAAGARHVKIVRKEEQRCFVSADADLPQEEKAFCNIKVLADAECDEYHGETALPEPRYLDQAPALNPETETGVIECKILPGLSVDDAVKLDALIQKLNIGGNASVTGAAEAEERAVLEYTVEY